MHTAVVVVNATVVIPHGNIHSLPQTVYVCMKLLDFIFDALRGRIDRSRALIIEMLLLLGH